MLRPRETWHFDSARIGRHVLVYDEVDSTNSLVERLATAGAAEGTVVLAEHQTTGRGRFGRSWQSRRGTSLLVSALLYPPPELRRPSVLTALAAVAVSEAVSRLAGLEARIKWPNDLLVRGKKVCGILIEQGVGGAAGASPRAIVGIGLNLNQTAEEFAEAALPEAASLAVLSGIDVGLRAAAEAVVRCLDRGYALFIDGEGHAVEAAWKARLGLIGRRVVVEKSDGSIVSGRLRDVGFEGMVLEGDGAFPLTLVPETVALVRDIEG